MLKYVSQHFAAQDGEKKRKSTKNRWHLLGLFLFFGCCLQVWVVKLKTNVSHDTKNNPCSVAPARSWLEDAAMKVITCGWIQNKME